ncbi:Uncharacterized protein OS=Singulisphaera acidiphila (strain ATCC BAA-1392 / DSM 18658 / VKM B-2454 / MOB10) GN=Sinac_5073 PE=4 SV=1 [Gemmataceae bacterium]|nr:Uncharacterized protein OS=Singulisphaera acidiphila (strain ATCC BAA-1392 / DSM 18658 / VKM B-2454 / MOB10) GN=Sinac_5073 PE=4 SV=1 [Gemmataceae bacterium]VTT97793.1 Uncharacterized protein OS=Singulisphaera acidiphila (strain ATCC BAA-1392 / DSM 18658 / VKM B-2454 / MOB10) GN=Sinac_5073 PE=4 SV=1 [Gemmataceae bacterium]
MPKLRAPTANGEVLAAPDFAAVPALVEENRRRLDRDDVEIGGVPLREFRAQTRHEVLELAGHTPSSPDAPLILAGHQPELSHPGVWAKNFALAGLAKKLGGTGLNLIVDNDTLKSTSLPFPEIDRRGPKAHIQGVSFDRPTARERTYAGRQVVDEEMFRTFPERAAALCANWGFDPLLAHVWRPAANVGEAFTAMRKGAECAWGCCNAEIAVSRISYTVAYARFLWHIFNDISRFQDVYNAAVQRYRQANGIRSANHPAPELARDGEWFEVPFWEDTGRGNRDRPFIAIEGYTFHRRSALDPAHSIPIARDRDQFLNYVPKYLGFFPRALTLTLFARVCLGDFFIHGIGGGKYDEVTDDIIRNYFGIEPPAYQVLSATLHLPLPAFPATAADLRRAERRVRDLHWNPELHFTSAIAADPDVEAFVCQKELLTTHEPPLTDRPARKNWYRRLRAVNADLRPYVADQLPAAEAERDRIRAEVAANAVLRRRDYPWVLYPEATLRPFLQQFLSV